MVHQVNRNAHFLLVTYPAQGHINPALQFAERVVRTGAHVTFAITVFAQQRMLNKSTVYPDGLSFVAYSDGYDNGFKPDDDDPNHFMSETRRRGIEALSNLIETFSNGCRPITCLVFSLLVPWATEVAHRFQLSSAFLWNQPATVFNIYYYYFSGYRDLITNNINDPSYAVKLPGLPLLKAQDLPSFLLPSNAEHNPIQIFQEQFELLSRESNSYPVLVNTFDELEPEALKAVDQFNMIGIGPLIPLASDKKLSDRSKDYMEWLDSRNESSVVYVSFGSMAVLTSTQMEELARGLVDSGRPFLWVIRSAEHGSNLQLVKDADDKYMDILREDHKGMIVPWCSQVEVLRHTSLGCFVTHCGWNSTLETLAMGVPVVAFPQWSDQGTTAKLIEDVWKVGVRVRPSEEDGKIVKSDEIIRCLDQVMEGERGKELRNNATKLKSSAREAVKEGGSSERNLRTFVEQVGQQLCL